MPWPIQAQCPRLRPQEERDLPSRRPDGSVGRQTEHRFGRRNYPLVALDPTTRYNHTICYFLPMSAPDKKSEILKDRSSVRMSFVVQQGAVDTPTRPCRRTID